MKNKFLILLFITIVCNGMLSAQCRPDSTIYYSFITKTDVKEPSFYFNYIYDGKDSLIGLHSKSWNAAKNKYENASREDYTLNSSGQRTKITTTIWMYNTWKNEYENDITLDANGNETSEIQKLWDSASNSYINSVRFFIVLNSKNKATQSLQQEWDNVNSIWFNRTKSDLTYDATSQFVTNQLTTNWNKDSNKWINRYKIDYKLKPSGQVSSYVFYDWDCSAGCKWLVSDSSVYHYDQNNRDTLIDRYFDGIISQKSRFYYNSNGCKQYDVYYAWDMNDSKFYPVSEIDYAYHSGSAKVNAFDKKTLSVFPNPVSDRLTIENSTAKTFVIRDIISGRLVLNGKIENGNALIDVSMLNNGLYILSLDQTTFKIIINH